MTLSGQTYGSSVLAHLGIANVFADAGTRYPETTDEEIAARSSPTWSSCPPSPTPSSQRHLRDWDGIAPAYLVDGQDLFWWAPDPPRSNGSAPLAGLRRA